MKMKKLYFIIGLVVISTVILISGCIKTPTVSQTKLEFSFKNCDESVDPYNESNLGVQEINWLDETTLLIKAYIRINCGETIENGNYEIENGRLVLKYKSPLCDEITYYCMDCNCAHELIYKFTNIEKKDYQLELKRIY